MFKVKSPRGRIVPRCLLAAATIAIAALQGCSESGEVPTMKTYPVKGSVKLADGKPLASGVVVFAAPEMGMEFSSPLGDDGSFVLRSSYGDGAPEGTYKVRIERDPSKADSQARGGRKSAAPAPYPAKYGDESSSGLTAAVKPADNALDPFVLVK
ncbi:carboxypeptidase-like regulatory domain-containing protein [Paludisphaera rhizosphaerae]|uniref:carboxypeptidase-like regulatory domain-containing protein n=2 Tax=Paludisphaera rhizosphaerae TaxID=2711216 RepID=UPI001C6E12DB|nr:carboxypeptidase-like regulatory domain-containing protein [Paludisphaera rhizosphaerae]